MKKDNLEAIYPLSPMQEGMLFHSLYAPQLEAYFEQFAYTLRGDLDIPAFKQAWQQVIVHHPVLRTLFLWEGQEKPLQVVLRRIELPWSEHDWCDVPGSEQSQHLQNWLQADRIHGFDLSQAPVMRLNLIRLAERSYHFTWSFHHLLLDGWSVFTVMSQLFSAYEALRQGQRLALTTSRPYRDYIAWLRQQDLSQAETFWRKTLHGFTTPTLLPITRSHLRKSELAGEYRHRLIYLSEVTTTGLQQLARQYRLTLNTLVQGAWALLLSRYSGQSDVVFGTTVSGRPPKLAGVDAMVGLFINTLPMRVQVDPQQQLIPWLQALQAWQVEARQYEYSPLVQVQRWSDVPRGQALFETLLIFYNYPTDTSFVEDMSLRIERMQVTEHTHYPLTVAFAPASRMMIRMNYAGTHFADESIQRMLTHLQTLLEGIVAYPQQRLADLPLLTEAERQQQLFAWNATQRAYPREKCLHTLFEEQVRRTPDAIAVTYENQQLTYATLDQQAAQLGRMLKQRGIGPDLLVGICLPRSPEMVIALLAVLKAGGAYVPLDPTYPQQRIAFIVEDAQLKVLLTQEYLKPILPTTDAEVICLDHSNRFPTDTDGNDCLEGAQPDNLAYVIYTSGSTGRPKGAGVFQRGLCNLLHWYIREGAISSADHIILISSPSFDLTQKNIFAPLLVGARLDIPSDSFYDPRSLVQHVERMQITILNWTPSAFFPLVQEAAKSNFNSLNSLLLTVLGGEPIPASQLLPWQRSGRCQATILNTYGPTECSDIATCYRLPSTLSVESQIPLGQPIDNVQVYILDQQLQPVPIGVIGELCIGGEGVGRGYIRNAELTRARFVPDPFVGTRLIASEQGALLYRTGDLARYLADGNVEFVGRVDDQVKVRGYRIEVGEIETVLRRHPNIRDVVILAHQERSSDNAADQLEQDGVNTRLVAYIAAQQEPAPSVSDLRTFLLQLLPEYMVPSMYFFLDALPTLPNGKIDRRALPAPDAIHASAPSFVAPRTPLEQFLAEVWQRLLKLETIGIHDNFFELGGDSIKAALAINAVQERLGALVYVVALFDAPSIAQLAHYLAEQYPDVVSKLFGASSLPSSLTATTTSPAAQQPCIDEGKVQALRQAIAPLSPRPTCLGPLTGKNPPAIFVLSPPRSGSTLLRVMLAGHPRLFAPPELELLSFQTLGERLAAFIGRNAFWLEGLIRAVMELKGCDAQKAQLLMTQYEQQDLPTQEFYRLLQEWLGERLLVDKTPAYALDLAVLQRGEQEFEQARYLHLIRHPRAMIRSFEDARLDEVFFRHPHHFSRRELAELIWVVCEQNIQQFLRSVPAERQHMVVFEELVQAPQRVMEDICQFLGLPYHPAMIEPYQGQRMTDGIHPLSRMIGDVKFHTHQGIDASVAQRWQQEPEEEPLAELTWELAASLGYEQPFSRQLSHPSSSTSLPPLVPAARQAQQELPLSYMQERLWFLHQWDSTSTAYNVYSILQLEGKLHVGALEQSLNEIVRRHDILRTSLQAVDGQPRQVIAAQLHLPLPMVDLGGLTECERQTTIQHLAQEQIMLPFDLGCAPLLRITLVRVLPQQQIVMLTTHHSISDGWSMSVLRRELTALYAAFMRGQPSPLPELPIQFADYALWQRGTADTIALQSQLTYWKRQLADLTPLALPTDHPRPPMQRFQGRLFRFRLSEQLTTELKLLSQREGVTLFMLLLAGFQLLLSRYSGQTDIAVGTTIANRSRKELENLIGPFINTLVLRTDLSHNPSVHELLADVRRLTLEAYANQDLPFDKLVEALNPQRSLSHNPLFQVMFILQNTPPGSLALPELQVSLMGLETTIVHFDLTLNLYDTPRGLVVDIDYDRDLFEEETIERLSKHYQQLLLAMTSYPERPSLTLPLLTAAEQEQLYKWNATAIEYPHDVCLHGLFEAQVERTPDAVALVWEQEHLSYQKLNTRANHLAAYLLHAGVIVETPVGLCFEQTPASIIAVLGVLKAGSMYVPLDPASPPERLTALIQDAAPLLVLTQANLLERLPSYLVPCQTLATIWAHHTPYAGENGKSAIHPTNAAYVLYTSGSTGTPKGVIVEHRQVLSYVAAVRERAAFASPASFAMLQPLTVDSCLTMLFPALLSGSTLHLLSRDKALDAELLAQSFSHTPADYLKIAPSHLAALLSGAPAQQLLPRLGLIIGGEASQWEWAQQLRASLPAGCQLYNHYGPTETTVGSLMFQQWDTVNWHDALTPLGRPLANTRIYVLDRYMQPVPVGVVGELHIAGAGLARGYLAHPELTAERFLPDPFCSDSGERMYRTGDLVVYRSDGTVGFMGRNDEQVKIRGYRIEPGEIEAALRQHPAVRDALVIAQEEAMGEKRLVAYVIPGNMGEELKSALRQHLNARLPLYMLPSHIIPLEAFPLTTHGKVDRRTLSSPEWFAQFASEQEAQSWELDALEDPRTPIEEQLVEIWSSLLQLQRVGIHQDFFQSGGHSLLAMRVIARVRATFKIELPLQSFFTAPTIAAMAQTIEEQQSKQSNGHILVIQRAQQEQSAGLLEQLDYLSDEEMEALFATMVTEEEIGE